MHEEHTEVNEELEATNQEETVESMEAAANEENAGEANSQGEKKYTDEDVNKIIRNRLAKEREKFSKAQAREQKENELEEREKNLVRRELKADARDNLVKLGLPQSAAEILNYNSKEDHEKSVEHLQKFVEDLRSAWEKERATGRTPRNISNNSNGPDIRSAFKP